MPALCVSRCTFKIISQRSYSLILSIYIKKYINFRYREWETWLRGKTSEANGCWRAAGQDPGTLCTCDFPSRGRSGAAHGTVRAACVSRRRRAGSSPGVSARARGARPLLRADCDADQWIWARFCPARAALQSLQVMPNASLSNSWRWLFQCVLWWRGIWVDFGRFAREQFPCAEAENSSCLF